MRLALPLTLASVLVLLALLTPGRVYPADVSEAELLALEVSAELLPPAPLVAEITSDLIEIRSHYPFLAEFQIYARGDWSAGDLFLKVDPATATAVANGQPSALDPLNDVYGPIVEVDTFGPDWVFYRFSLPYHPVRLGEIYLDLPEVILAQPNFEYGDGSDIQVEQPGLYWFTFGWGDCPSGCLYEHHWRIQVDSGETAVVSQWGDPVSGTAAPPAPLTGLEGEVSVAPNPFNPRTRVRFELAREARVVLELFDLRGHRLRRIDVGRRGEGPQSVVLDGVDEQGRNLASGSYFVALRLNGERVATQRVALVR